MESNGLPSDSCFRCRRGCARSPCRRAGSKVSENKEMAAALFLIRFVCPPRLSPGDSNSLMEETVGVERLLSTLLLRVQI